MHSISLHHFRRPEIQTALNAVLSCNRSLIEYNNKFIFTLTLTNVVFTGWI